MPTYEKEITIPANTPWHQSKTVEFEIWEDVITRIEVVFPIGCALLAKCVVAYGLEQLAPKNIDGWIAGHGETVVHELYWECPEKPCKIIVYAWNDDDTYPHTLRIRITALPKWIVYWHKVVNKFVELFSKLIGLTGFI